MKEIYRKPRLLETGELERIYTRTLHNFPVYEFYHYVFTPFSNSAHGTWNYIIKYSLKPSSNPLHCFIKRPIFLDLEPDPHFAELAMRYLNKTFGIFDKYYKPQKKIKNSYQIYLHDINMLIEKESKNRREHGRLSDTQK